MAIRTVLRTLGTLLHSNVSTRPNNSLVKFLSGKSHTSCPCKLSSEFIEKSLKEGKKDLLRAEMNQCENAISFKNRWETYKVELLDSSAESTCKAFNLFNIMIPYLLPKQKNIKGIDQKAFLIEDHLSIFSSQSKEVTLAGEGGRHVGRRDYWNDMLTHLQNYKHCNISIISIGGALGYDALTIAEVLENEGLKVGTPIVVDPNILAAFFSDEKVNYYAATSQQFFDKFFERQKDTLYVIHLGTTLNVIQEDHAVQLLKQLSEVMEKNDILSLIIVSKKQFHQGKFLSFGKENAEGLSPIFYLKTGQHYKTVVTNPAKFLNFMEGLGFKGDIVDIIEKGQILRVAFIAYKGVKKS